MFAIRNFFLKYHPDDYEEHQRNKDWIKKCALKRQTVHNWVNNFKKTGYHRLRGIRKIKRMIAPPRPDTGTESIFKIKPTDTQKSIMVHEYQQCKAQVKI